MSDALRRQRAVHKALFDLYPEAPEGNLARHLNTLTALISGIVGSRKTNLPKIAEYTSDNALPESRIKRFSRWIDNGQIDQETYFLPYAQALIDSLAHVPFFLVMDASAVGRKCATLMLCVLYKKRALPLAWLVVKGNKGHFSEENHIALLQQVQPLIPDDTHVIFLGDGEFDGTDLQTQLEAYAWDYVCRTAKNIQILCHSKTFAFQEVAPIEGACMSFHDVRVTLQSYGPVNAIAWWEKGYADPLYLITNVENPRQACRWYRKRFHIETFFSDQKSRGFYLHKSHLSDPNRLCRLMIAACLTYIWIIFLGILTIEKGWVSIIHRADRCDLSLFQLGLKLLSHLLNKKRPILVAFCWAWNALTGSVR